MACWRLPILVFAALLAVASFIALLSAGGRTGFLDPDSVSATGSRAVAEVLCGQGVEVVRAPGIAAATQAQPGDTLVIPTPDLLTVEQAKELASTGADLVVVGASNPDVVQALVPGLSPVDGGTQRVREPGASCPRPLCREARRPVVWLTRSHRAHPA